jgi:AraC family transcriptional activator of mtrCDE
MPGCALSSPADAHIATVLEVMRNRFSERWTLDRLASIAGLSRTAFTTRFRLAVGQTPMRHLTKVRLGNAAGHLATDDRSLLGGAPLGMRQRRSAFQGFRRDFGVSPGPYRRSSRQRRRISTEMISI